MVGCLQRLLTRRSLWAEKRVAQEFAGLPELPPISSMIGLLRPGLRGTLTPVQQPDEEPGCRGHGAIHDSAGPTGSPSTNRRDPLMAQGTSAGTGPRRTARAW